MIVEAYRRDYGRTAFVQVNERLGSIDRRLDSIETRMESRFSAIDQRFNWIIGTVVGAWVTTIATQVGTTLTILFRH